MQEFGFLNEEFDDLILGDEVCITDKICDNEFLVSNSKKLKSQIYAPEINFYLKNSQDDVLQKAKNVSILFQARAITFDMACDMDYQKEIGRNIILLSDEDEKEILDILKENDFKVILLTHQEVKFLYGEIGEIYVNVLSQNDEFEVKADIVLIKNAKDYMLRQSGCYEINGFLPDEVLALLNSKVPVFKYKSAISYDSNICQFHQRRSEHCAKCVDICPTTAILKHDKERILEFSHIDCNGCGGCVSVCPSGAIDYAKMPKNAFCDIAKMYEDKIILITPDIMDIDDCDVVLPKNVLPFAISGEKFLSEMHFLTLLQESGASLIFYSDIISNGEKDAIRIINEIYNLKFNQDAIFVADDEISLREALKKACIIQNSKFNLKLYNPLKREIFSKRLEHLVGDDDFGKVSCGEWVRYGSVSIDESNCTLCLSCVGACNVGALIADQSDNSIKFNASLCTTCGYCEASCSEKDTLKLTRDGILLRKDYFNYQILAKDTLFKCVECGKEFAPTKAVNKIAKMMEEKFKDDEFRLKSLYCCADCKAKIMIKKQILEQKIN